MADNNLEAVLSLQRMFADMSELDKRQAKEDLAELQGKTRKVTFKVQATVKSLRRAADKLDKVWKDCKTAQALGTSSGIMGGILTVVGGVATIVSAGAATPLLLAGMGFGVGAAGASLGAGFVDSSINSAEIKKAEKDLKETLDCINDVRDTVQWWLNTKEEARLLFILGLAVHTLQLTDPVIKLLHQVFAHVSTIPKVFVEAITRLFADVGRPCAQTAAQAAAQTARQFSGISRTTVQVSRDGILQVSREINIHVYTKNGVHAGVEAAEEAGIQAAGKAGAQAAQKAGGLIIALTIPFLIWDAIDLGFTIRDLLENKGSEAASVLREKANELEQLY